MLRTIILGRPHDFLLHRPETQAFARTVEETLPDTCRARGLKPPRAVFVPFTEFTNRTLADTALDQWTAFGSVYLSKEPADGVLLESAGHAGAVTLADCLAICLLEETRLAVLHGGLRCLIRDDGESIIVEVVQRHAFHPEKIHAWIGAGIGPCCYGLDHISDRIPQDAVRKPIRGPRRDKPYAVDLRAIVRSQLLALGVPGEQITIDERCTSCFEDQGIPPYWSHVRGDRQRNLFVAWLT